MGKLDQIPTKEIMISLVGKSLYECWECVCALIEKDYDMEQQWNDGGKKWTYEYKYRRGGKTLCCLYAKENVVGLMIVFGKEERLKFETQRDGFSEATQEAYDEADIFHDGKWVIFNPANQDIMNDIPKLLGIKRKPNKK